MEEKREKEQLSTISVDVQTNHNGTYDVYISTEGSSGCHYPDISAEVVGENVADLIDTLEEAASGNSYLKPKTSRYLLVGVDDCMIDDSTYGSYEEAYQAMAKAYEEHTPKENDPEFAEISFLGEWDAVLYANGENVYLWKIIEI